MTAPPNLVVLDTGRTPPALTAEELREIVCVDNAWRSVLVIGYDDEGTLKQRSTKMTKAEALFLIELFKKRLLGE